MADFRKWLAVAGLCGLALGVHAAQDTPTASAGVSSTGPFFFDAQAVSGSGAAVASVLSPDERVAPAIDRDWVWQRYYAHLMSPARATPFVVLFTDARRSCEPHGDDEDERAHEITACEELRERTAAVTKYVRGLVAAEGFPSPSLLPVVHIAREELPRAFAMHRVSSTPSLMWFPPRATGRLQRQAHAQTNLLAFTGSVDVSSVAQDVTGFLHRCYAQSGLSFPSSQRNARGRARPSVVTPASQEDSVAETVINALPFLAIGLYALLTAMQYRTAVLKVLRNRFTWLALAQGVLYVSLSGLFHSIIHKVSAFYAHPQFGIYLIHPSGRKQFFLEGLVNGTWSFVISFALFSIVSVMPKVRSRYARDELFRWSLMGVGVAYMCLHLAFAFKHPWLSR